MTEPLLTAKEIAERLHISRSTFYLIGFFRQRVIRVTKSARRYRESDVQLYLAKQEGRVA